MMPPVPSIPVKFRFEAEYTGEWYRVRVFAPATENPHKLLPAGVLTMRRETWEMLREVLRLGRGATRSALTGSPAKVEVEVEVVDLGEVKPAPSATEQVEAKRGGARRRVTDRQVAVAIAAGTVRVR